MPLDLRIHLLQPLQCHHHLSEPEPDDGHPLAHQQPLRPLIFKITLIKTIEAGALGPLIKTYSPRLRDLQVLDHGPMSDGLVGGPPWQPLPAI